MKPILRIDPKTFADCCWSNGKRLNARERERLSIMMGSGKVPLLSGESPGLWFVRIRKVLEGALLDPRGALGKAKQEESAETPA